MGRELDWGTLAYSAQFTLMVRAMHIKYRDGEGKNWGREMAEHTFHSTLICLMDREAFKCRNDGRVKDRISIWDEKAQTMSPERDGDGGKGTNKGESSSALTSGGVLLMTNLMEPHFPSAAHLTAPVCTPFSLSSALYIPLSLGTAVIMHAWRRVIILPSHCVNINKTGALWKLSSPLSSPSLPEHLLIHCHYG